MIGHTLQIWLDICPVIGCYNLLYLHGNYCLDFRGAVLYLLVVSDVKDHIYPQSNGDLNAVMHARVEAV